MDKDTGDCVRIEIVKINGVDWSDESLFFTHRWRDETSQFDSHPSVRWNYGCECYERDMACRVPRAIEGCDELVESFVSMMMDEYPDTEGFWVD